MVNRMTTLVYYLQWKINNTPFYIREIYYSLIFFLRASPCPFCKKKCWGNNKLKKHMKNAHNYQGLKGQLGKFDNMCFLLTDVER